MPLLMPSPLLPLMAPVCKNLLLCDAAIAAFAADNKNNSLYSSERAFRFYSLPRFLLAGRFPSFRAEKIGFRKARAPNASGRIDIGGFAIDPFLRSVLSRASTPSPPLGGRTLPAAAVHPRAPAPDR